MSAPGYSVLDARRILVLAPHADDEALGCGGTIALCVSKGAEVRVAVISDGGGMLTASGDGRATIIEKRRQESREASGILGVAHMYYLDFPDGELRPHKGEIREKIVGIVSQFMPDVVLSPSPLDAHDDHITVSEVARELLSPLHELKVGFYEIYETIRFNSLVDISAVLDIKERAVLAYRYSLFDIPEVFLESAKGLNRFRSLHTRQMGYYEAFWLLSAPVSTGELVSWVTYGLREDDPAGLFLSKIRAVDELFYELRGCTDSLGAKDIRIRELEEAVARGTDRIDALKTLMDAVDGSLAWRIAQRYYRVRDTLLPPGSYLRKFYHKMMSLLK